MNFWSFLSKGSTSTIALKWITYIWKSMTINDKKKITKENPGQL